ncbi:MAG: histidine phosphatase family protein [Nocardioides sp.]
MTAADGSPPAGVTHMLRHGRTGYSAAHLVTGRPDLPIGLDEVGVEQCHRARPALPLSAVRACVVSEFPRTAETARILLPAGRVSIAADARLNEIDYGTFEGQPFLRYARWLSREGIDARPPKGCESQRQALLRMCAGLLDILLLPGPRLVVTHGLLLSVLRHVHAGGRATDGFFPEAGYLDPLTLTDSELRRVADDTTCHLAEESRRTAVFATVACPPGIGPAARGPVPPEQRKTP